MGKLIITTNISLDGVTQDPTGEEGFRLGGWFQEFGGKDLEQWAKVATEEALAAEAMLLGRKSDEWFASRWLGRTGEKDLFGSYAPGPSGKASPLLPTRSPEPSKATHLGIRLRLPSIDRCAVKRSETRSQDDEGCPQEGHPG